MQRKRAQGFACRRAHRVVGEPSPNMQTSRLNSTKPCQMMLQSYYEHGKQSQSLPMARNKVIANARFIFQINLYDLSTCKI